MRRGEFAVGGANLLYAKGIVFFFMKDVDERRRAVSLLKSDLKAWSNPENCFDETL